MVDGKCRMGAWGMDEWRWDGPRRGRGGWYKGTRIKCEDGVGMGQGGERRMLRAEKRKVGCAG